MLSLTVNYTEIICKTIAIWIDIYSVTPIDQKLYGEKIVMYELMKESNDQFQSHKQLIPNRILIYDDAPPH